MSDPYTVVDGDMAHVGGAADQPTAEKSATTLAASNPGRTYCVYKRVVTFTPAPPTRTEYK